MEHPQGLLYLNKATLKPVCQGLFLHVHICKRKYFNWFKSCSMMAPKASILVLSPRKHPNLIKWKMFCHICTFFCCCYFRVFCRTSQAILFQAMFNLRLFFTWIIHLFIELHANWHTTPYTSCIFDLYSLTPCLFYDRHHFQGHESYDANPGCRHRVDPALRWRLILPPCG